MTRRLVVVRPEPGNSRTADRARELGWQVDQMPLFAVEPVVWTSPDPTRFDALLLTSANAVRHGGPGLDALKLLPVLAVGEATAAAARAAGFQVAFTGDEDAAALVRRADELGHARLLHLAGRDHVETGAETIPVYASIAPPPPGDAAERLAGAVLLLHSARAARAVAALAAGRRGIAIAAISAPVLDAAGPGWRAGVAASAPTDEALLAAAQSLAD